LDVREAGHIVVVGELRAPELPLLDLGLLVVLKLRLHLCILLLDRLQLGQLLGLAVSGLSSSPLSLLSLLDLRF